WGHAAERQAGRAGVAPGRTRARLRQGGMERSHPPARRRRGRRPAGVRRPRHSGEWRGNTLTVVEPLTGGAAVTAPDPPRDATHELALGGAVTRSSLGESAWWEVVRARIEASDSGLGTAADAIAAEAGERPLGFGRGYGDWTPWNMRRIGGRLVVWDWERAGEGAPVGI